MNKKGFTLVELLAVIAILAILVILALPNVLGMYKKARQSSFENEIKNVYRSAQSQFLADSLSLDQGDNVVYTNTAASIVGVNIVKSLNMSGNSKIKYYVLVSHEGKVLVIRVSNGTFSYSKSSSDSNNPIKIEDIDVQNGNDVELESDITNEVIPPVQSTITYNCNGGGGTAPATTQVSTGTALNLALASNSTPCKYKVIAGTSGMVYYQTGWGTSTSGTAMPSVMVTGNMTLYATWNQLFSYNGSYNIINDGSGDWRVEFKSVGDRTLTINRTFNADIHAVGGGGGGGGSVLVNYSGGGGGGGRVTTLMNRTLSASSYIISVGAGGSGGSGDNDGFSGSPSRFGSLCTAEGGFGGGKAVRWAGGAGGAGGSGGGGGSANTGAASGIGGTNGSNGSDGTATNYGIGGTAGIGQGTTTKDFGNGTLRAGGGGGGARTAGAVGGTGGGGAGGFTSSLTGGSGTNYYGGGGGGQGNNGNSVASATGGSGGCGIVIMRNIR